MNTLRKPPSNKNRRDFLIIIIAVLIINPTLIITQYQSSKEKESSEIPKIYIKCNQEINGENYVTAEIEINKIKIPSQIKYRGFVSFKLPKKGYRLELDYQKSLFNMRIDDDWQLFSCWIDFTRMRTKIAFELWRSLFPSNPTAILPNSKYVKLYLNNKFQGIYLLSEKQDRKLFGLDEAQNNLNSSLILQPREIHYNFREIGYWEQDYPNKEDGIDIADQIIEYLTTFINNTSEIEFFNDNTGIFSIFDKMNLIDFYLFNFFIHHRDFWNKNYYLVRNSMPSKFFLIPWDFDFTFGQFLYRLYEPNLIADCSYKNLLFERLINNSKFMREAKIRWIKLRSSLWTNEFILGLAKKIHNQIHDLVKIDIKLWKDKNYDGETTPGSHMFSMNEELVSYDAYIFMENWIRMRLDFCDSYFALN